MTEPMNALYQKWARPFLKVILTLMGRAARLRPSSICFEINFMTSFAAPWLCARTKRWRIKQKRYHRNIQEYENSW
ncbi:MAG TPA: hypothetical protein PK821_02535, partial [Victivallales bacterium]|nr:hypothetical protein [Victivallales bacterium]